PDPALEEYQKAEQLAGDKLAEIHFDRALLFMKVKDQCEPALPEFKAFASIRGAALTPDALVYRLTKECEDILVAKKQAEEAARQMERQATQEQENERNKKALEEKKKDAPPGSVPPSPQPVKATGESGGVGGSANDSAGSNK